MPNGTELIQPRATTAATTTPVEPDAQQLPTESQTQALPDELLKIPALQAVFAGNPPAVSATIEDFAKRPEAQLFLKNREPLMKAGFGLYRSLSGDLGVVFNQFYIHGNELKEADKTGRLLEVAPPFDTVNEAVGKAGEANPVLQAGAPPAGFKAAAPPSPGTAPTAIAPTAAAPGPASTSLQQRRAQALQPGGPTTGPKPGAGRLLAQVLKPVI